MTEQFTFTGHGGTALPAVLWQPETRITAVLQITHGMTEHMGRYETLAQYLLPLGIVVAGFDLRGHGKHPGDPNIASCGVGGWDSSIADMHLFFQMLGDRFPQVPRYMLGFSLGSFLLREYLGKHPEDVAGAIILGTGHQPNWLLSLMMAVVAGQMKKSGFDGTTDLVRQLSFGAYNQQFKPNRTCADWLCADQCELNHYLSDPLIRRDISAGLFWELLGAMKRTGNAASYASWNKEMPILLLYGQDDPVGNKGKGVQKLYSIMKKAGIRDITFQMFPDARHDLLHEEATCAETVRHCIADWMPQC